MATKSLTFMEAVKTCFKKYANFNGRARRSEFWWFYLFLCIPNWIIAGILQYTTAAKQALVDEAMATAFSGGDLSALAAQEETYAHINIILIILLVAWSLFTLLPMLSAWARRLHDVGKSGHLLWTGLICGIGFLVCLILCIPDGQPQANQYGESPKYVEE